MDTRTTATTTTIQGTGIITTIDHTIAATIMVRAIDIIGGGITTSTSGIMINQARQRMAGA